MWPTVLLTIYCLLIVASSLFGGVFAFAVGESGRTAACRCWYSFARLGLMLGVAVLHQFPHSVAAMSDHSSPALAIDRCSWWLLFGLLTTFFMLRVFHFHHHEAVAVDES